MPSVEPPHHVGRRAVRSTQFGDHAALLGLFVGPPLTTNQSPTLAFITKPFRSSRFRSCSTLPSSVLTLLPPPRSAPEFQDVAQRKAGDGGNVSLYRRYLAHSDQELRQPGLSAEPLDQFSGRGYFGHVCEGARRHPGDCALERQGG